MRTKLKIVGAVVLAAGFIASAKYFNAQAAMADLLERVRALGTGGIFLFIALYVVSSLLMLPGFILTIGGGAIYGFAKGTVVVSAGAILGATAAFAAGRTFLRGRVEKKIAGNAKLARLDEAVGREGWKIVALTRLSPLFPFNLLNYFYGITKVSLRDYFIASWIGMMPGTMVYVYLGSLAGDLASINIKSGASPTGPLAWVLRSIGFAATLLVGVVAAKIAKKTLNEKIS